MHHNATFTPPLRGGRGEFSGPVNAVRRDSPEIMNTDEEHLATRLPEMGEDRSSHVNNTGEAESLFKFPSKHIQGPPPFPFTSLHPSMIPSMKEY